MTQSKKEIVTKPGSEISVVDLDINSEKIEELAIRCKSLPQDLSEPDNYRMSQDVINEAREMRGKIKKAGKGLKEDAAKWLKKVVKDEKRLDGEIVKFLDPEAARKKVHDDAVKAEKERKVKAEKMRIDTHMENINTIRMMASDLQGKSSTEIESVIEKFEEIEIDSSFEEFEKEASDVYEDIDFALQRTLINAQTVEENDRKRVIENQRLEKEREALAAEKAENERIRLANEETAKQNEIAAQKIEDAKKAAEEKATEAAINPVKETEPMPAGQVESYSPSNETVKHATGIASSTVQKKIDDDNSVVDMARKNTLAAIESLLDEDSRVDVDNGDVADALLSAIIKNEIPNVKYDIY